MTNRGDEETVPCIFSILFGISVTSVTVVEAFKRHSLKILRPQTTLDYTGTRPVWCGDTEIHTLFPALDYYLWPTGASRHYHAPDAT
jgi:hypothetical protein